VKNSDIVMPNLDFAEDLKIVNERALL